MTQVFVGATNVGSMTLNIEPELVTNSNNALRTKVEWMNYKEHSPTIEKGEEVGMFKLGSTVVLVFEAPANLKWKIAPGEKIRFGEIFAEID